MRFFIGFLLLFFSLYSWACSPRTLGERFWPNPVSYGFHYLIDSIEVNVASVSRGGPDAPCGDAGIVVFEVVFPDEDTAKSASSRMGIYFIAKTPDEFGILTTVPMKPEKSEDGKYYVSLAWGDPAPRNQQDIHLEYEVRFLSNKLELSDVKASGVIEAKSVNQ